MFLKLAIVIQFLLMVDQCDPLSNQTKSLVTEEIRVARNSSGSGISSYGVSSS